MDEVSRTEREAQDLMAGWRDPPGMGRTLVISSAVGVVSSLVLITLGMMATGQVWQSSLALGVFIAGWGGLGFGSMIGGVVYLTRIENAAKALEAETAVAVAAASGDSHPPVIGSASAVAPEPASQAADAA